MHTPPGRPPSLYRSVQSKASVVVNPTSMSPHCTDRKRSPAAGHRPPPALGRSVGLGVGHLQASSGSRSRGIGYRTRTRRKFSTEGDALSADSTAKGPVGIERAFYSRQSIDAVVSAVRLP